MPVQLIRSETLTDSLTSSVPYAYAAVVDGGGAGDLVFTAGACPLDDAGDVAPVGDLAGQAARVMDNLAAALAGAGSALDQVAKTTVYVATSDRADLVAAWEVVRAAFGDHDAPSTLLAVPVLGYPDQLVEVEAVAVRPPVKND
jgi:enamine deaminase RidA (YjgF/YER057c/UK114 family)